MGNGVVKSAADHEVLAKDGASGKGGENGYAETVRVVEVSPNESWTDKPSLFSETINNNKYAHVMPDGRKEQWADTAVRQGRSVVRPYAPEIEQEIVYQITAKRFMPAGRYLYAAGLPFPQTNNCVLYKAEDSRAGTDGWAETMSNVTNALMTGAGVGVVYSWLRPEGALINGMGGKSTGPIALMQMVNEAGRHIMQGGSRRAAIWAGLHWNHPDVFKFLEMKNWPEEWRRLKETDLNFPLPMEGTNVSVILDTDFFDAYLHGKSGFRDFGWKGGGVPGCPDGKVPWDERLARTVYARLCRKMCKTAEPGASIDAWSNDGEHLRNACTEVTSRDSKDVCNLSSINMARVTSLKEFKRLIWLGIGFMMCGTLYAKLPVQGMYGVRDKNRRLGLGLMGVHEWLLQRNLPYGPAPLLQEWMEIYRDESEAAADYWSEQLGVSRPIKLRSIAPTGTISIVAETTSGIEPIFAVAYKRRYLDGQVWKYQYVIDATAKRLIDSGVCTPAQLERQTAHALAENVEHRIAFQAFMQKYVDHAISSTINLPQWGTQFNNDQTVPAFAEALMRHLPSLRGITAYPNGSRFGQPLTPVPYEEAIKLVGTEMLEQKETAGETCVGGFCNS